MRANTTPSKYSPPRRACVRGMAAALMGLTMATHDPSTASATDTCAALIEELDRFLTRAKLSPEKGRPVIAKRAEAEAHRVFQEFDDAIEAFPVARGATDAAVDDELAGPLGDLGVEIVHQHAQGRLGGPALGGEFRATRGANAAGVVDARHGFRSLLRLRGRRRGRWRGSLAAPCRWAPRISDRRASASSVL